MKGNLWQVVVIALALALVAPAFINGAFAASADENNATETLDVDYLVDSEVSERDVFNYSSTVTITQDTGSGTTTLDNDTDYNWFQSNGSVEWLENGNADNTTDATIEYRYWTHSDRTQLVATILEWNVPWIGLLFLMTALGFLKVFAIGSGGPF